MLGGGYHYAPAELRGQPWPDSGFRYAQYTARVVDRHHPVCAGLDDFELSDELYCCPVFEDDVLPLVRAEAPDGPFRETYREVLGTTGTPGPPWRHPAPSDLIAWAKSAGVTKNDRSIVKIVVAKVAENVFHPHTTLSAKAAA